MPDQSGKITDQIERRRGEARVYANRTAAERRADRRQRLLDAALDAFGSQGYRRTSIEQLCSAASVSTRSFYEEFGSRERLLIELHDQLNDRAFQAVVSAIVEIDGRDARGRAIAGVSTYFDVMTSDRRWARIALTETVAVSPTVEQHRRGAIDRFAALMEAEFTRLADLGLAPKRDYRLSAIAVVGAILELVNVYARPELAPRQGEAVDEAVRALLAAIDWTFDGT